MRKRFSVIDDFLPETERRRLWDAFRNFKFAPDRTWNKTFRLTDGFYLSALSLRLPAAFLRERDDDNPAGDPAVMPFLYKLYETVSGQTPTLELPSWNGLSLTAYVYPPGTGLGWHTDDEKVGAFIYYVHPEWKSAWGGELLISDSDGTRRAADDMHPPSFQRFFGDRYDNEALCRSAGHFVYPRPNRLVLLSGGTLHCIKKVEAAAGDGFRASLSGFFFPG